MNISNKLQRVFSGSKVSKEVMFILQIIAIVLILTIIGLIIYFTAKKLTRSRRIRQEEDALLLNILKDADEVYKKAFDYYNKGDYTQGLRFLYISLLIRFNKLNIIRINKAKTNKQYLKEIGENKPEFYEVMAEFTLVFNMHWYGGKNAVKATFVNSNEVYGKLISSNM
jgi:flagellar basal body-associated protein FliL